MHRIDTSTAQKDKFGAGKNGFTRGNPQTGTPATDLDDDYFDMLQEELAGVVEASGAILDKSKHDQLQTALKKLLLSRVHPFADIKADGLPAVAEALGNLGLGGTDNYANLGNGYRLIWVKGNVPGGALAAATAVAVSLTFSQAFGTTPLVYWPAVSTPSGVTAGAGIVATCADLTATGMSLNLYNASNANKQITAVIGFAIGKV
jgi:hypothetical protein